MVAATYTSDLTDIFLWESTTGVSAYGGGGAGLGASPDYAIEGTNAVDKQVSAAEKGFMFDNVSNFTINADDHFFIWVNLAVYGLADTRNNRGIHVSIGDDTSNFVKFHVNGSDTLPAGGIQPYAIRFDNTTLANRRTLVGTPGTTPSQIGAGANVTGTAKFSNLGCDATRIGTGYDILNGTGADPEADFAGIASDDEGTAEGIFQTAAGGFKQQGKLRIGSAGTACEFLDSNTNIFFVNTLDGESLTDFTEILIENASSILTLDNVNFIALGTHNRGRFEVLTSAATLALTNVGFIDTGVTILGTGSTLTGCRWIGAGIVTANGATLTGSSISGFEGTANTSPLIWDVATDPDGKLDDMSFTKGTAATHAIEFGTTSPLTMTLRGMTFAGGYVNTVDQNDSALHIKRTSGTVTINMIGASGFPGVNSYRTDGATVNIVIDPVTALVNVKDNAGANLQNARVLLEASDGTGDFPFVENVTITRSASTASVSHTAHGLVNGDIVVIRGADQQEYSGPHTITNVTANAYDYTVSGSPATPATGNRLATAQDETSYDNSPTTEGTFSGGTGHAASDALTLSKDVIVTVDAVSAGVVTQFTVNSTNAEGGISAGDTLSQRTSTGSGTGFSLTPDTDNLTVSSSGAMLNGLTDASGNISASRTFTLDQPVKGFVRKSTASPRFKSFTLSGTIDNVTGLTINVRLILDE